MGWRSGGARNSQSTRMREKVRFVTRARRAASGCQDGVSVRSRHCVPRQHLIVRQVISSRHRLRSPLTPDLNVSVSSPGHLADATVSRVRGRREETPVLEEAQRRRRAPSATSSKAKVFPMGTVAEGARTLGRGAVSHTRNSSVAVRSVSTRSCGASC